MKEIGTFKINTQEVMVSDPCYTIDSWCQGIIKPMVKGNYRAFVDISDEGDWGERVARLKIVHEEHSPKTECQERTNIDVGVDSGQAGFWDIVAYRNRQLVPEEYHYADHAERWYEMCCRGTDAEDKASVQPFGVVSRTGYGDGRYNCYVGRNARGLVVAAEIVFIGDEDEE
jgi:hypothetical protein